MAAEGLAPGEGLMRIGTPIRWRRRVWRNRYGPWRYGVVEDHTDYGNLVVGGRRVDPTFCDIEPVSILQVLASAASEDEH